MAHNKIDQKTLIELAANKQISWDDAFDNFLDGSVTIPNSHGSTIVFKSSDTSDRDHIQIDEKDERCPL